MKSLVKFTIHKCEMNRKHINVFHLTRQNDSKLFIVLLLWHLINGVNYDRGGEGITDCNVELVKPCHEVLPINGL